MPETRRLNRPIECGFCLQQVNPFIINRNKDKYTMIIECPSCGKQFDLIKAPREIEYNG